MAAKRKGQGEVVSKKAKKSTSNAQVVIEIPPPQYATLTAVIEGDTEINIHRLGKKLQDEFEARDSNKPIPKKQKRNYDEEFIDSIYFIDKNGFPIDAPKKITSSTLIGFPSSGFKKAMVFAARQFKNLKMTELRGRFFVNQYTPFVRIEGKPKVDKFWRRIGGKGPGTGTPDIGIRAKVFPWKATLEIRYLKNLISAESILNLLNTAGFSVGVGEDRPDKNGNTFGMWHVAEAKGS